MVSHFVYHGLVFVSSLGIHVVISVLLQSPQMLGNFTRLHLSTSCSLYLRQISSAFILASVPQALVVILEFSNTPVNNESSLFVF